MRHLLPVLFLSLLAASVQAAPQAQMVAYSTGTGFVVNRDGYVLTNHHVVESCSGISVHGENSSMGASIYALDKENDLALLKTAFDSDDAATFDDQPEPVKTGDSVFIVGYPGLSWQTHKPLTRTAKVVSPRGPQGEAQWLQFSDTVAQGNSGGPLLNSSGHVIGVVVAKAVMYRYREGEEDKAEKISQSDLAISLPIIKQFLHAHNVLYREAFSNSLMAEDRVRDKARPFIVNVHCRVG